MRQARVLIVVGILLAALLAPGAAARPAEPEPAAEAWILVDARDGERLAARNASGRRSIASATKLMTAYLALREHALGRRVTAPEYRPTAVAESLLGLEPGERIRYRDLIYALVLASANDGAVAVAEDVSGSVADFVRRMNATAERLGLDGTSFANPIGLDDPLNYSTAADLAALTRVLLRSRLFRRVADSESHTVRTDRAARRIVTRNDLLARAPWVTGVKTGFTAEAGNVLVGAGERKGVRLVAVVLGAPSESARDEAVLALLEYGFSLYERRAVVRGREAMASPPVDSGGTVELLARRPLAVAARRDQAVETEVNAPGALAGPIRGGERLGKVIVTVDGRKLASSALIAARAAPAPSLADDVGERLSTLALLGGAVIVIVVAVVIARRTKRSQGRH